MRSRCLPPVLDRLWMVSRPWCPVLGLLLTVSLALGLLLTVSLALGLLWMGSPVPGLLLTGSRHKPTVFPASRSAALGFDNREFGLTKLFFSGSFLASRISAGLFPFPVELR